MPPARDGEMGCFPWSWLPPARDTVASPLGTIRGIPGPVNLPVTLRNGTSVAVARAWAYRQVVFTEVVAWACIAVGLFGVVQGAARLVRSARGKARDKAWQMLGMCLVTSSVGVLLLSGSHAAMIIAIVFVICQIILLLLPKRQSQRTRA
jgi:hypothetical protein